MANKLEATFAYRNDVTFLELVGSIDEDNQFDELTARIQGKTLVVLLGSVERINSCGVRDWVNWMRRVQVADRNIVLVECSPSVVTQMNVIDNFVGASIVKSFYLPFLCTGCNAEKMLLVDASDVGPADPVPVCRCDECDQIMEFDEMPDSYFGFLARQQATRKPPDQVESLLEEFRGEHSEKGSKFSALGSGVNLSGASGIRLAAGSMASVTSRELTAGSLPRASTQHREASSPNPSANTAVRHHVDAVTPERAVEAPTAPLAREKSQQTRAIAIVTALLLICAGGVTYFAMH